VVSSTNARQQQLQQDLASTLVAMKSATTEAEAQKQSAKVDALNGQIVAIAATRRDEADQVVAQKAANDSRLEEERNAAAELEAQDDTWPVSGSPLTCKPSNSGKTKMKT